MTVRQKRHKSMKKFWSGREVIKVLLKVCYQITNQKGSHIILVPKCLSTYDRILPNTVPNHTEIKQGTLNTILARANISKVEFINLVGDP